jgi:uncharacterized protein YndB with AHSA1/START domain
LNMPPRTQNAAARSEGFAETKVIADRSWHAITLTRTFAASREQVFEAWTRPEHVSCWWDAAGAPLTQCEIDLRPGGAFKFVNQRANVPPFTGIYREIAPHELLIFEAMGAVGKVILEDIGGKTLLTVVIKCQSAEQLDQFLKMGVDVGTSQTLDNLVAYVGSMQPT